MDHISDSCRLCLDSFAGCFTTIDNPQLKKQIKTVFCFPIEPKRGYSSDVCQSCSYAISEFYQYSEKVRQNQEVLSGNVATFDQALDSKDALERIKIETFSDVEHPETIGDPREVKDVKVSTEEVPIAESKTELENVKPETVSGSGLPETIEDTCEVKDEVPKEEVQLSGEDESYEPPPKKSQTKQNTHHEDLDEPETSGTTEKTTLKSRKQKIIEDDELFNKHYLMICDLCGTSAANYTELSNHFWKTHQRRYGYLMCCNKKLNRRHIIREHIAFHADPDVFRCEVCGNKFKNKDILNTHRLNQHSSENQGPFQCDHCSESFEQKLSLTWHMKQHAKIKCPQCGKIFTSEDYLSRHMTSLHSGKDRKLICDTCGKEFVSRTSFKRHMNEHMGIEAEQLQCGICQRWLKGVKGLHVHMTTLHTEDDREHQCDLCLQKYPHAQALYVHKQRTHAEKKHECKFCGQKFKKTVSLRVHLAKHTGEEAVQRLQCQICQRWLKGRQCLRNHMEWVHSEHNEEHQCDLCQQKFPHLRALSLHKFRAHTEPKYECEFCGKKFKVSKDLKEHRTNHTGEVLYACEYCGKPINRKTYLYNHIKRKHPTEWAQKKQMATQKTDPSLN